MQEIIIDKIYRSKRRTFSLEISAKGELIVRAPKRATDSEIRKLVTRKSKWIIKTKQKVEQKISKVTKKDFKTGESFLFLGRKYNLVVINDGDYPLFFNNESFLLSKEYHNYAREIFIQWYKEQACTIIKERASYYSNLSGLRYNKIGITNAKRRWGSCSAKNNLNFSWRLIMAPLSVIDYIIIHELAHIKEKNHSKKFWHFVESILPNYKNQDRWLKENGHLFVL